MMETASVEATAWDAFDAGLRVLPPKEDGSKAPITDDSGGWKYYQQHPCTPEELRGWYEKTDRSGVGIVCGEISGNIELFEFDDLPTYHAFKALAEETGLGPLVDRIEDGYLESTPTDTFHWFYRCSVVSGNTKLAVRPKAPEEMRHPEDKVKVLIETRGNGGFAIIAPSNGRVHPTGKPYTLLKGSFDSIPTITPEERAALWELARTFDQMPKARAPEGVRSDLPETGRPGDDFNAKANWDDILSPHGWTSVYDREEVTYWRRPGKDLGVSATTNYQDSGLLYVFSTSTGFDSEQGYSLLGAYALLEHGGDFGAAAKALAAQGYGDQVKRLAKSKEANLWPEPLADVAFHGLAGQVVHAIEPHTEADPAALLVSFLTFFGNVVGRGPHAMAEADRHGTNVNAVIVGETSKARKGSGTGHIRRLSERIDSDWTSNRIMGGMSSGEGLVYHVRDPIERQEPIRDGKRLTGEFETVVADPGVEDKRLLAYEPEFASVLKVMLRDTNILSTQIRQAWDSGTLRTLTKNNPVVATGAHISILGHITKDELLRHLTETEAANGFGNRFLWICSKRSKVLPRGGGTPNIPQLVKPLHDALIKSRDMGEITWDREAGELWDQIYETLSGPEPGLFGAITARAEAQVLRLSVIYAAIDGSGVIQLPHLLAALAVWDYAEASARYIFGDATGDYIADRILETLRQTVDGLSRTQISSLLGRNIREDRISRALGLLLKLGRVQFEKQLTKGRAKETWYAT